MQAKIYRTCAGCGREDINVPRTAPGGRVYYCPICRGEARYLTKDWLSTGAQFGHRAEGGEPHRRREAVDLRETEGGSSDQGGPVPAAPTEGIGPAKREAGEE